MAERVSDERDAPRNHTSELDPALDTFPKLVQNNAERIGGKVAIREKDLGIWQSYTWRDYLDRARLIALGLASLGFTRGDKTAIVGDNRPQLYWAMLATQALGGVPVPLYQDSIEKEMQYILEHAEARFAVVEDQEQVDKLLHVKDQCPHLESIVYDDPRGLRHYAQPFLVSLERLEELGKKFAIGHPGYFEDQIAKGQADDIAVICYTSGTTGSPKGVMLSHRNLIVTGQSAAAQDGLRSTDEVLAYLPMAWVGDHIFSYAQCILIGFAVNCPESAATVLHDLREIGPTYFFAPPRIWENILTNVMIRIEDAAWAKRKLVHFFLDVAQQIERRRLTGRPVPLGLRLLYWLGRALVYQPLQDNLGMRRIRLAYTAGEAIGPEIFLFFRALGINVKQLYGMTESSVFIAIQRDGDARLDTVGTPIPGVDIRISEQGEVLFHSPGAFRGYYKNADATKEMMEDGWVHTGDAGFIDHEGHLKIIDRAKDVGRLADGTLFPPKYIENKLKFSPYIKEAMCVGQGRPCATALINIDLAAVGSWAERRNMPYTSYTDLAQKPEVYDLIYPEVVRVNKSLGEDELLRGAQIKKYLILHKELDADDQEMTRTRKLRRRFIAEKYVPLIDALYSGTDHVVVDAQVTYEDGRTGTVRADVRIREVESAEVPGPRR
jgi:long-chain acyl-CoA synthetase